MRREKRNLDYECGGRKAAFWRFEDKIGYICCRLIISDYRRVYEKVSCCDGLGGDDIFRVRG